MLPNTAANMRQSSAVPTTASAGTMIMMNAAGTLLEGVASTLDTVLVVEVVKCVLDSERCVNIPISGTLLTGGLTADDRCDDGVSAECTCVDTVEQSMGNIVSPADWEPRFSLLQIVQALVVENVILIVSCVSFTPTVHHLFFLAALDS